jgi:hypothetical protein
MQRGSGSVACSEGRLDGCTGEVLGSIHGLDGAGARARGRLQTERERGGGGVACEGTRLAQVFGEWAARLRGTLADAG